MNFLVEYEINTSFADHVAIVARHVGESERNWY